MIDIEKQMAELREVEWNYMSRLICSRNELINRLLEELPLSDKDFQKALRMRDVSFEYDKVIWAEVQSKKESK